MSHLSLHLTEKIKMLKISFWVYFLDFRDFQVVRSGIISLIQLLEVVENLEF